MRIKLLALAALCFAATVQAQEPPLPPIVFQSQPVGRVLNDLRAGATLLGGEKGVKALNDGFESLLGEKGFEGLDLSRPVVGYVVLAPKPADITAVVALPVSGESEFLDLYERLNKQKPKPTAKDKDVFELPLPPPYKAVMRFSDRYAYIAYGANPTPHIDAKALVPTAKLYDPVEPGLVAARLHFDRIPEPVKKAVPGLLEEAKKTLFGGVNIAKQEWALVKPAADEIEKLVTRYLKLAEGGDAMAARLVFDAQNGSVVAEATLAGKPGTELAKTIAAFKPTANKFGTLVAHADTIAGFQFRLPLFEPELRAALAAGLEAGQKESAKNAPAVVKPVVEELFGGLIRTAKNGEFDIAAAVRGPNKDDVYTAVIAVGFDDPSKLGKEFRTLVEKDAPPQIADNIKWDVDKAGNVNIHTWKPGAGGGWFVDFTRVFGGEDCTVAFAFAPQGVLAVVGPDAVAALKDALAVKPVAAPVLDVVVNPARLAKFFKKANPNDNTAERILGNSDKLKSALSVTLTGGQELKATATIDLNVLPKAVMQTFIERSEKRFEPVPGDIKK